jgi:hypothetical protein
MMMDEVMFAVIRLPKQLFDDQAGSYYGPYILRQHIETGFNENSADSLIYLSTAGLRGSPVACSIAGLAEPA